ncbi:hypothetical protein EYE40_04890 [Glaciihabitans arcticus]|uniref:Uncharacterized protein n=1 Tax=Glaciihabitans arcticus TaxID=2668039 RepID=A0A4Q9GT33_9MICO|nr:hypothetical protein [Glaciihabitans arcticus]TBN56788.1 hypothetical protein EYE40_04890 [Glaciihabitans arcticus]
MKLYSDFPARRTRQIFVDVLALVAIGAWVWLGTFIYGLIMNLSDFGVQMEASGAEFRQRMTEISKTLGDVPLIGGGIRAPFDGASDAGASLESAGQAQQLAVQQLATGLGVGIAVLPILMILILWLIPRLRFVRRASAVQAQLRSGASLDLLALRALATQKLGTLAKIDADPLEAWRRGDAAIVRSLAQLELQASGIKID